MVLKKMNGFPEIPLLLACGLVAGLIDSIAGGGGLLTVPFLTLLLGPGSLAIGTNKVAAVSAALVALLVYMRAGHVRWRGNRRFALFVGIGSIAGALVSPHIPAPLYRWILVGICPCILWIVYRKDFWTREHLCEPTSPPSSARRRWVFWILGFACGFYDGIAGPGGGTLMFLSLFLIAEIPLLTAMATAKVANVTSAGLSLVTYGASGNVRWDIGAMIAIGISVGAFFGARFATRNAAPVARVALLILATLFIIRLALS